MIFFTYVSPITAALICMTNIIEMYLIKRMNKLKTASSVYILNLCITDLMVGFTVLIVKLLTYLLNEYKDLGENTIIQEVYAAFLYMLLRLSLVSSILNLLVITVDRVIAVKKPITHRSTKKRTAIKVCISTWSLSGIVLSIHYTSIRFQLVQFQYSELLFPVTTFPTIIALIITYRYILIRLKIKRKRASNKILIKFIPNRKSHKLITEAKRKKSISEKKRIDREWNIIKLALTVVIVFALCWIPVSVYGLLVAMNVRINNEAIDVTFFVAILNSLLNPLIYFHHIRTEIIKIFLKIFSCCCHNNILKKDIVEHKLSTTVNQNKHTVSL